MPKTRKEKSNSIKHGRPPLDKLATKTSDSGSSGGKTINVRKKSSKATRKLINSHHQLQKSRAAAVSAGNERLAKQIEEQIEKLGGLQAYQAASLTGQDKDRGGDSSEKLVEWLQAYGMVGVDAHLRDRHDLRVLEVGALSSRNAISSMIGKGIESVSRIDLHSQELNLIQEIDFMDLPIPATDLGKFDIVSLSLVLNYVPDIAQRGEMLRRTTKFLRHASGDNAVPSQILSRLPQLFIVLPLSCLSNSRYMTCDRFVEIMASLGYVMVEHHNSQKLTYMLFIWTSPSSIGQDQLQGFKKMEINPGKSRNNFAIVMNPAPRATEK